MDQSPQPPALCREFLLTSNHLHGEENCEACKAYNLVHKKKPKKMLNANAAVYKDEKKDQKKLNDSTEEKKEMKKPNTMNPKAQTFKATPEESKEREYNPPQVQEDFNEDEEYDDMYPDMDPMDPAYDPNYYGIGRGDEEDDDPHIEYGEQSLALFEKYKNCECCHGMVFQCKGDVCKNLEACYCYMRDVAESNNHE